MSANDILDVLNISRDEPPKKKQRTNESTQPQLTGMARELYNLIGPNTPPVQLSSSNYTKTSIKDKLNFKPSPWTKMEFTPRKGVKLFHWMKGSKEFLEAEESKGYFFDKFNVGLNIPELVDEETYGRFMEEIREFEKKEKERRLMEMKQRERERQEKEREKQKEREKEEAKKREKEAKEKEKQKQKEKDKVEEKVKEEDNSKVAEKESSKEESKKEEESKEEESKDTTSKEKSKSEESEKPEKVSEQTPSKDETNEEEPEEELDEEPEWSYEETKYLFNLCKDFELKWPIIYDRYQYNNIRTCEDLKEQFYRVCIKILQSKHESQSSLIDSLRAYSKPREIERKQYLENLLKRTPAEMAEEESLVIEARRFELAAKKMLIERSNLLTLLDSPQSTQNSSQYQSSQGLANLYNNLMIFDKHQKKKQAQQQLIQQQRTSEPVPPPIPIAASSSFKKDKSFQTHLQQYLSSLLKQNVHTNPAIKQEANSIQQLLSKRLTQKEEEAYGLYYHGTEKLTPGVVLRSSQKLPSLQQKQSTLKSVNLVLQELDIPTGGGTTWKPVMPTRKTMSRYDELIRTVVALLEVKKAKDKLESEIKLIKSQRGML
ncbi:SWR1-complex protein 4 [Spathaspora sp. JA1]|nr:SWR1-complex protein 4 [Spathaspora sp. JA1]